MNRQERRAKDRGRGARRVKLYNVPLTPFELELVTEALDCLQRDMDAGDGQIPEEDRTELQQASYRRAGAMRDIFQSELEGRPYYDSNRERLGVEPLAGTLRTSSMPV